MPAAKKKKKSRLPLIFILIFAALLLVVLFNVFGPSGKKDQFLYVHTGSDYATLLATLKEGAFINNVTAFDMMAKQVGLPSHMHPGKYQVKWGMSNYELLKKLRNGRQVPVKLVINKVRTEKDLISLIASKIEADSQSLSAILHDPDYVSGFGMDTNTIMCAFIPNTYEMYWNTTADKAFRKIHDYYRHFWTEERRKLAADHGLNPVKATIMASIVEEETNVAADKLNIASVYQNRIKKGMKLQADPTVKFAIGDFAIHRVTGAMLKTQSPYNTYQNEGLPPGPICTPSPSSIDAVLNAPQTNYIYFCAKADLSGASVFAATDAEHLLNARLYQQALNARGIH